MWNCILGGTVLLFIVITSPMAATLKCTRDWNVVTNLHNAFDCFRAAAEDAAEIGMCRRDVAIWKSFGLTGKDAADFLEFGIEEYDPELHAKVLVIAAYRCSDGVPRAEVKIWTGSGLLSGTRWKQFPERIIIERRFYERWPEPVISP